MNSGVSARKWTASLAAVAAGIAFGCGATGSQVLVRQGFEIPPIIVAQFLTGTLFLGVLVLVKYRDMPSLKDTVKLLGLGLLQPLAAITYYYAIAYLSVGQAVAIQFQYVWMTVLIQSALGKTKPGKWVVISSVCILMGTMLASGVADEVLIDSSNSLLDPIGLILAVACAVFYAFFIYLNSRVAVKTHPVTRAFVMLFAGGVLASVLFPSFFTSDMDLIVAILPGGAVMSLITNVIPILALSIAGKHLLGGIVAILTSAELPAAVLSGLLILGDTTTPLMAVGIVVILGSIVLSEMKSLKNHRDANAEGTGSSP
jgi:drug/metabolite transporter (DMT)-like permease